MSRNVQHTHFSIVFSNTQRVRSDQLFASGCLTKVVVHFPDPRQPTRYCSALRRQWNTTDNDHDTRIVFKGTIYCLDHQTLEAIQARLSTDLTLSTHLLCSIFDLSPTKTPFAIVIDMALSDEYLYRGCRLSNLSWSRRMWAVASRADLLAFTSVFYSVLGGAYSSLSKANANYAYKAGSLAFQQIKLAQWLKDPILESKCWLYFAEDLIQLGRFRRADKIIARQWRFAHALNDRILLTMCESVQAKRIAAVAVLNDSSCVG
ncbi:predicted protein [Lichtheimia corymbifera JMRC:FSU:9682]|uniref:Uncharacterized protein n=1 Tax=Lichtheimia corymbifera JMRC:FSU:9682 TaxID=1263082 RepID=A0A068RKH8_9FUNG|nr:predicted protein [Lichtheimia corymbifera JMRC:FSU:9682]